MGVAYFIVLEREIEGVDSFMDGKCLARATDSLDQVARDLGVCPLSDFFSIDPEHAADFLADEGVDSDNIELPALQQFSAEEGLTTVRALLGHSAGQTEGITDDLQECERLLNLAAKHGIKWHFEVDY
ncbi:hypothetical protein [Gimesia aquarii]|uniref:Uncharacterized protein n=1 Tax=Gimesia aquarii TaxID=2527964 RepID=A0A517WUC6_9PLAN|nr:hypothetical protein [Gimesia aquarii]QDU08856.1 hypothetical protein V202x_22260 [Gimesia aquarii]